MNSKLTLSIQPEIIEKAKRYAKRHGRSLSDVVESYLKAITSDQVEKSDLRPITKKLLGSFRTSKPLDYKAIIKESRTKKYD